jgi:hypothetical protein
MGYDWSNMDWIKEDHLYAPKRKVNNWNSRQHPHIIGSFYIRKMERPVEHESLGERRSGLTIQNRVRGSFIDWFVWGAARYKF